MPSKNIYCPIVATLVACLVGCMAGCGPPPKVSQDSASDEKGVAGSNGDESRVEKDSRVKAEAGVGKKGQLIKKHEGPITTPIKALFNTEQKLAFMGATRALQLYKAAKGPEFPKTSEEYMREIITPNHIELPELPEGQYYEYDPKTSELMVVTPPVEEDESER